MDELVKKFVMASAQPASSTAMRGSTRQTAIFHDTCPSGNRTQNDICFRIGRRRLFVMAGESSGCAMAYDDMSHQQAGWWAQPGRNSTLSGWQRTRWSGQGGIGEAWRKALR